MHTIPKAGPMTTRLPASGTAALSSQTAQVLRTLALDEDLKWRIPQDPAIGPLVRKVARRYVAGENLTEALERAKSILATGHRVNVEYLGESCRDPQRAGEETEVFLTAARLLPPDCCRPTARSPSTSPTSASPSTKNSPWPTPPGSRRPRPTPAER